MKMNNYKRYLIIMAISVLLNIVLATITAKCNLPVWLDCTGTMLAAFTLEPTAGLLVGLVDNFYSSLTLFSPASLFFYSVSVAVALIFGFLVRRNGKVTVKSVITSMILLIIVSSFLSATLTYIINGGVSTDYWERYFFNQVYSTGIGTYLSCLYGVFIIKIFDVIASYAIVGIIYKLLPKSLKYNLENKS